MEKQRIWQEPKLIVLARSTPEESVLATCKSAAGAGQRVPTTIIAAPPRAARPIAAHNRSGDLTGERCITHQRSGICSPRILRFA